MMHKTIVILGGGLSGLVSANICSHLGIDTIILEKGDYIIPAELLYDKINGTIKCHYFDSDDMIHGSILMENKYIDKMLEIVEE